VNKYAFDKPNYDVEEILTIIEPNYSYKDPVTHEPGSESMVRDRKIFIEEVFKPTMKKKWLKRTSRSCKNSYTSSLAQV